MVAGSSRRISQPLLPYSLRVGQNVMCVGAGEAPNSVVDVGDVDEVTNGVVFGADEAASVV